MKVLRPTSTAEALDLLAERQEGDAPVIPIAGGTDLLVSWHHQDKDDWTLLDLTGLSDLRRMRINRDHLEIGGLTTYWDVITSGEASSAFPMLADAARQVGSVQIQTRGTWAGNIANGSPAADGVPVMMAYDAVVVLTSTRGTRELRLDEYYYGYKQTRREADELIAAIRMPRRQRDVEWFHKVGARQAQAIAKVGVAVAHDNFGWRIAANSVAPYVCRCGHLEKALQAGTTFASVGDVRDVLCNDVAPIDDMRSTADYRLEVLSRLLFVGLNRPRS